MEIVFSAEKIWLDTRMLGPVMEDIELKVDTTVA